MIFSQTRSKVAKTFRRALARNARNGKRNDVNWQRRREARFQKANARRRESILSACPSVAKKNAMPRAPINREQSRKVDRWAIEVAGFSGLVLMENAGRGAADLLGPLCGDGRTVICCGKGNNAGDGLVVARHLELRGKQAETILFGSPDELSADAAVNYRLLVQSGASIRRFAADVSPAEIDALLASADWIVDALLGTGAQGEPRSPLDLAIDRINAARAKRLALDVPSGLDCDSGKPAQATVRADHTCTFVAAKIGFQFPEAAPYVGQLHVADIGMSEAMIAAALAWNEEPAGE
jgi:NAD(P)H-hydrate epimerase